MLNINLRRCLSLVLTLVMIFTVLPAPAHAADTEEPVTEPTVTEETTEATEESTEAPSTGESSEATGESSDPTVGTGLPDGPQTSETTEATEPSTEASAVEAIQARIDAIVTQYGITADMTDNDIAYAISLADGDTIKATMDEMDAIEADAQLIATEELLTLELDLYEHFRNVWDMLFFPMPIVTVTGVSGVEVTCDSNGSISESSGTVTVKAAGSFTTRKTTVITITNTSGSTATISFNIATSNIDSDVSTIDDLGGTFSQNLTAGQAVTYKLCSTRFSSNNTGVATLSNFSVVVASTKYDLALDYDTSLGSVTIDSAAADPGTYQIDSATLKATANSDASFLGWLDSNGAIISTDASYNVVATGAMHLTAVFAGTATTATAWFLVGSYDNTGYLFNDLNEAATFASSATNKTVVLMNNGTLAADNYTIPAGVTLLIPYDSSNTLCTTAPTIHDNSYTSPSVYRTLTMADGATITVNGAISVSGTQSSKYAYNGMVSGTYGKINMASGSSITVNSGANLYCWGYITGSGSVTIKSGGTVYEDFQIADYRGGDATTQIVDNADTYGVFPFNQFYLQNVEVPMTIYAGAMEYGHSTVTVTLAGTQHMEVPFIGTSDSMFIISDGYVVKDYVEGTGRTRIDVYGDISINEITIELKVSLVGSITIETAKYSLPIPHHFTIWVNSGTITFNQSMAFLPGSELYIQADASCVMASGKKFIAYDLDEWLYNSGSNGYSGTTNLPYVKLTYVPGGNGTTGRSKDALIQVNGTFDASAGGLYTTSSGANICSTGSGKVIMGSSTETTTYQVITADTDVDSWPKIAITSAKLQNAENSDPAFVETTSGTYNYCATHGLWYTGTCTSCTPECTHTNQTTTTVDATCTTAGSITVTCDDCGEPISTETIAAAGHTEATREENKVEATCGKAGSYDLVTYCSVCSTVISTEAKTISATGNHSYNAVVTAPTCTTGGYTTYTCSVCGDSYTGDSVSAVGHTEATREENKVEATCGKAGSYDLVTYCSVCSTVISTEAKTISATGNHSYNAVVTAPTCTAAGYTTYTCSVCGDSYTGDTMEANGHSYSSVVTNPTCTEKGYTTYTCSVCGDSYTGDTVEANGHTDGEAVVENRTESTCTVAGSYDSVVYCSICKAELSRDEKSLELAAHTEGEAVEENRTESTCTVAGSYDSVVYCSICKAELSREKKTLELSSSNHENTTEHTQTNATCTDIGYTAGTYCNDCKTWISGHAEIPAKDHSWSVSYSWTEDGNSCTATRACANDASHNVTETVAATGTEKTAATCEAMGTTTYTANFEAEWATAQTKDVVDIAVLGHTDADNDGNHTCDRDGCTETVSTCGDSGMDHICDTDSACTVYNTGSNAHADGDLNHKCDYGCSETIGTCEDADQDHACDYGCGKSYGTHEDTNKDHVCDYGCSETIGTCEDADQDHACDYGCGKSYGTHEDTNKDHACDYGCSETIGTHADSADDKDHVCDYCGKEVENGETCSDVTTDNDHSCDICGKENVTSHSYESVVTPPTCETEGYTTYTCGCGDTKTDNHVDALGHTEGDVVVENNVDPTCTTDGSYDNVIYCSKCDAELSRETISVTAKGHKSSKVQVISATCTVDGYLLVTCNGCGKTFDSREEGFAKDYLAEMSWIYKLDATGHTPAEAVVENKIDATCTADGSYESVIYCSVENCKAEISRETVTVDALGHTMVAGDVIPPTCTEDGYTIYTCSNGCGTNENRDTVPATGHSDPDGDGNHNCDTCGEAVSECGITYVSYGNGQFRITNAAIAALKPTTFIQKADLQTLMSAVNFCADVVASVLENEDGFSVTLINNSEFRNHTAKILQVDISELDAAVAQLAEKSGTSENKVFANALVPFVASKVSEMDMSFLKTETLSTLRNLLLEDSTCCDGAVKTAMCYAMAVAYAYETDDAELISDVETISILDVLPTDEFDAYVDSPTGIADLNGLVETLVMVDSAMSDIAVVEQLLMKGFEDSDLITLVQNALDSYNHNCAECGTKLTDCQGVVLPAVDATCTKTGLTEGSKCVLCNTILVEQETVAALNHSFTNYVSDGNATCTEDGTKTAKCDRCDEKDTVPDGGSMLGHAWDNDCDTECNNNGCGETREPSHSYDDGVITTPATCTDAGVKTFTCGTCSDTYTEAVEKLGHTEATREENRVEATCGKAGSYDNVTYCSVCSTELSRETVTVDATGNHSWAEATYDAPKTCTVCGATEGSKVDRPAVDVQQSETVSTEIPEDSGITEEEAEQIVTNVVDYVTKFAETAQPDTGIATDAKTTEAKDKYSKDEDGNTIDVTYETTLVITLNMVAVSKDGETAVADKVTFDVTPMLYAYANGQKLGEEKLHTFESEITFRLPVDANTAAKRARIWHAGEEMGLYTIETDDATGLKFVTVKSKTFSEFSVLPIINCSHSWSDGTCSECGEVCEHSWDNGVVTKAPTTSATGIKLYTCSECALTKTETLEKLAIKLYSKSLKLEELVCVSYKFTINSEYDEAYIKENSGLLVWTDEDVFDGQEYVWGNETYRVDGLTKNISVYEADAKGVAAKEMGDAQYAVGYIINKNGEYEYSEVIDFNPVSYAKGTFNLSGSAWEKLRPLMVAMMNYGAAAQIQFEYKTDSLMNDWLTDEQQALTAFDSSYIIDLQTDTSKFNIAPDIEISDLRRSVILENNVWIHIAAILNNVSVADAAEAKMLYWSEQQYDSIAECTLENVSGTSALTPNGSYYQADIEGIAAKHMGNTFYYCLYIKDAGGTEHFSELKSFSIHFYCDYYIGGSNTNLSDLCEWIVAYSHEAKEYFGN